MVSLFFSLSTKSVFAMLTLPRGSAHEIAFAAQMHENRGRVPRFSYFQREKFCARTCGFTAKIYVKLPKNEEKSK